MSMVLILVSVRDSLADEGYRNVGVVYVPLKMVDAAREAIRDEGFVATTLPVFNAHSVESLRKTLAAWCPK